LSKQALAFEQQFEVINIKGCWGILMHIDTKPISNYFFINGPRYGIVDKSGGSLGLCGFNSPVDTRLYVYLHGRFQLGFE